MDVDYYMMGRRMNSAMQITHWGQSFTHGEICMGVMRHEIHTITSPGLETAVGKVDQLAG